MAVGLPVVSTRVGGIPEAVEDGVSGYLVAPGAIRDFVNAVSLLLENRELRQQMGQAGQLRARESFSLEAESCAFADLYRGRSRAYSPSSSRR